MNIIVIISNMSLNTFIKITTKALKFAIARPIQRFNIYNRSKKYLGPDAKYFAPAPRAIGAMSQNGSKPIVYPHLEKGYKSIGERRAEALAKKDDDKLVIEASNQLEVTKSVVKIEPPSQAIESSESSDDKKSHRPLPKCTNLPLQDIASIWHIEKTPPGRINVDQLQEIMINKLGDHDFWTAERVAEKYNIKPEYAESLFKYMKQIRIVVSPRMSKILDYVGMNDKHYQAAKHLVYHVDPNLRSDVDKQYDDIFLPGEDLDEEVRKVVGDRKITTSQVETTKKTQKKLIKRPEPLRLAPLNRPKELESTKLIKGEPKCN